MKKTLHK